MAAGSRRGRAALGLGFASWFQQRFPELGELAVEVTRPAAGLSSETVLLDVAAASGHNEYVARLPPHGELLFPDYALARQAAVQSALAATGLPVADTVAMEFDEDFVGAPFLLMKRAVGQLLSSSYVMKGWLFDLPPEAQAKTMDEVLGLLARIHLLPYQELPLGELSGGGPTLEGGLDYWDTYLDWATKDHEGAAIYRAGLAWCRANVPASPPPCLLWGDPQLVNLIFDEAGHPTTILDWEMACLGPAEIDLAWFVTLHELAFEQAGVPELPGFPGRAQLVAAYETKLGRPVIDLAWFEVYAHVRAGAIVLRIGELMRQAGMPTGWTTDIPQPRHIARLIGAS